MAYSFFDFLKLIGSLGLFLYGMKIMSEGIQKVAGEKLRSILSAMTKNRALGVLTGVFITSIIQSSSATSVMVVSFVNAGLLSLAQAISVIMGANIGTTITAWIISLLGFQIKISAISLPIIGFSFPLLFSKKDTNKSLAETFIGFAILFIGLDFLKNSTPNLSANPEMFAFLQNMTQYGFGSTLIFVAIGTILTIVVQSSSAAMALTLVLCNNGWIGFENGAAIVLGENIGTTITANLAALIGNKPAKRAALSHTFFNIIGVFWMLIVFSPFTNFIEKFTFVNPQKLASIPAESVPMALSIFHSSFNIINTLVLIFFVKSIETLVSGLIKDDGNGKDQFHLEYIGTGLMTTPELSILEARKEIIKYTQIVKKLFNFVPNLLVETDGEKFQKLSEKIEKYENIIDRVEVEIATFLTKVSENELSERSSKSIRGMLRICSNLEKIGDLCYQMSLTIQKKNQNKAWFTQSQRDNLKDLFAAVNEAIDNMMQSVESGNHKEGIQLAIGFEEKINKLRNKIRDEHFESIEKGEYNIKSGLYYNNIYTSCEKIGDHILNVNEALTGINIE
jgi:phosphate:Na+ symporter